MEGTPLIALSTKEFDRLATGIRQQVADGIESLKSHLTEKPLSKKEAADYLQITPRAFASRMKSGAIPPRLVHRNGGSLYFFASELQQLLKAS